MPHDLVFLHTSAAHIATFTRLLAATDSRIPVRHVVDESLLAEARVTGITPALAGRIAQALEQTAQEDGSLVVCTCSTIGGCAEQVGAANGQAVVRIDRAMAERAIATGSRILVAAALASTLAPTRDLLLDVAQQSGKSVTLSELLCDDAWPLFEQGDLHGYHQAIADRLQQAATSCDVIVLAQASMAGAAALCTNIAIPILSSPQLGVEAAVRAYWQNRKTAEPQNQER